VKNRGLVSRVFGPDEMARLKGRSAIGHIRYSTTGEDNSVNVQPLLVDCIKGSVAVAHNGNLTNAAALRDELSREGSIFQTTLDTEVILHLVARSKKPDLLEAIREALSRIEGAYSLLFLTENSLIAVRDPHGVRPLVMGELESRTVFASETCAFDLTGAKYLREVEPGEMVVVSTSGIDTRRFAPAVPAWNRCVFEFVYFSRPDSILFGRSVYQVQKELGRRLAKECPVVADTVLAVPDSGNSAALGYSEASGIPFEMGLVRNHYVGRTFIQNTQAAREAGVRIKLNPVRHIIEGRRIVIIDDSIVRGTTSRKIVRMLRSAGAKEIHFRVSSPPYKYPCFYGVDTPTPDHLIAHTHSVEQIRAFLEVDTLAYLSCEGLLSSATGGSNTEEMKHFCTACFNGEYRIPIDGARKGKEALEKK
jgi:amidophosphoribosyltransferase